MPHDIEWLRVLFFDFPVFRFLLVFLGVAFMGELALITFAFLSAQGLIPLPTLILLSFLGTYSSDLMWFLLGRTRTAGRMLEHRYAGPAFAVVKHTIKKLSQESHFAALCIAKFLFGTRILTLLYISKERLYWKKFLHYNAYAVLLWVLVVVPIGYTSGLVSHIFENAYIGVGVLLCVCALGIMLQYWAKGYLNRREEKAE